MMYLAKLAADRRAEARNMAEAHAEGLHDELAREGCPECLARSQADYSARQPSTPWESR